MSSTKVEYKTLNVAHKDNYVILQIDNGKVNAIDTQLAADLGQAFRDFEKDDAVKGVILTGRPHAFSAGLDVKNLVVDGIEGAKAFWRKYLDAIQVMIRFPKPMVCAITGYAPAGATLLAICADYRVMGRGPKHVVGMHEFKLSLQIPEMLCYMFAYHMGEKRAWEMVQNATLLNSDKAAEIGLVDESVEVEEVLERAEKHLQKLMRVYTPVFTKSKRFLRKGLLKEIDREIEPMVEDIAKDFDDPKVQQAVLGFLAGLSKKK